MSTVQEIEQAIAALPREEFWLLTDRLMEQREDAWDKELEEDCAAGRLDALWQQAQTEIAAGETQPLNELLGHEKISE